MVEENKATTQKMADEAAKQNNKSLHDENKRIYTAVHEAKQNIQLLESTEKRIGEKVEIIHSNIETALEANNSRISE